MKISKNRDGVAKLAGVSTATVSRVYNNRDKVSKDKVEAVLKAAKQLGYAPDKSASALRRNGTGIITLIRFEKPKNQWYWGSFAGAKWFFAEVVEALMKELENSMYRLNLKTLRDGDELLSLSLEKECDGIIFFDVDHEKEFKAIEKLKIPSVICHHDNPLIRGDCSLTNNFKGGELTARWLLDKGYSKPAYISYHSGITLPNQQRFKGFSSIFQEVLPHQSIPLLLNEPGKEGGYLSCKALIKDIKRGRVDSIGVVNDMSAVGVVHALFEQNILPGRDIGLTAYDNMPFNYVHPFSLPSVDMRASEIYKEALRVLFEKLKRDDPFENVVRRVVEPILIEKSFN